MKARGANPWLLLAGWVWVAVAAQAQTPPAATPKPVAVVDGLAISDDDVLPLVQAQVQQLRSQEYQLKVKAIESLIFQKLVEGEARTMGISKEALLEQEVNAKAVEPSDSEVESYYLGQKDRINRPLEDVKTQLRQALKQAKLQQARDAFYKRLRDKAQVHILLSPPRMQVGIDPTRLRGNPDAPVTIVEFSDFQCPFCQKVQAALQEVLAKYGGRVRLAFRDYPLREIHPRAQEAAEAARCAAEQGKFWQYHDLLYADQSKLDQATLKDHARNLGMDTAAFEVCQISGKYAQKIDADLKEGARAGVSGTPGLFINGIFLSGAQPASVFEKIIDDELARAAAAKPSKP